MQKRKTNTALIIVALMAAVTSFTFYFFFGPSSCTPRPSLPAISDADKKTYADFIDAHFQPPADYIVRSFDVHDIVFLNNTLYHTTFEVVRGAVPALYAAGVRAIAAEFVLAEDQAAVDSLLTAAAYDEAEARRILSYFLLPTTYMDSLALLRDVWSLNRARTRGAAPMRVIGLGLKLKIELFTDEAYRDRKDLQKATFNGMTQEEFAFSALDREVIQKKEKALVFVPSRFMLKNGAQQGIVDFYAGIDILYRGTLAMLTRARIGDRALVVLFHNVWRFENRGSAFPVNGVLDAGMKTLPESRTFASFPSADSPCRDAAFAADVIDSDGKPVPLRDVCDAYLLNGPLYLYRALPLAPGSLTKAEILPFLKLQKLKPEDIEKYTAEAFINKANQDIEAANGEMANLPH
ncbi:MAG: hypothetical protein JXD23_12920 [Spirochaetales bacterium]|nr:hypothetical protein [Spirochaetales bacterium]